MINKLSQLSSLLIWTKNPNNMQFRSRTMKKESKNFKNWPDNINSSKLLMFRA